MSIVFWPPDINTAECILKNIFSLYDYLTSAKLTYLPEDPVAINTKSENIFQWRLKKKKNQKHRALSNLVPKMKGIILSDPCDIKFSA